MPWKNPNGWFEALLTLWPHVYAPLLAFSITVVRGFYAGTAMRKAVLEGIIIGLLTVALRPVLVWLKIPEDLAVFAGAFSAVMGVKWLESKVDRFVNRWMPGGDE